MPDRIPLVLDAATNLPSELQAGDTLPLSSMNASLQAFVNDLLVSSAGSPLVTSTGDFMTTSAA